MPPLVRVPLTSGPFFFKKDKTVDSASYKWLLADKVLPMIWSRLGEDKFSQIIFQEVGAEPHQAHIVMDWLDTKFGDRMLATSGPLPARI